MKTERTNYILYIKEHESVKLIERLIDWFKTILIEVCHSVEIVVQKREININEKNKDQELNKWFV